MPGTPIRGRQRYPSGMDAEMTVREIMTREYVGVSESDPVDDVVALMREEPADQVVVLRGSEPVGMLTPADVLALVGEDVDARETAVGDVMSGTVPSVAPDRNVVAAAGEMADDGVRSLLVTDGEAVVGVVSERDVVRATATLADRATLSTPPGAGAPEGAPATGTGNGGADVDEYGTAEPAEYGAEAADDEYSTQSVCEVCGSLTPGLQSHNGQLVCGDCREM